MLRPQLSDKLIILGPCSLESWEQIQAVANLLKRYQLSYIRTPLFKPRTHPESFQGLGAKGLTILAKLKEQYPQLKLVSEVCSQEQMQLACPYLDVIQVGARNMQNYELLKDIGRHYQAGSQVMLKRGFGATLQEWLASAEYLIRFGVPKERIILCERGSRSATSPTGVAIDFALAFQAKRDFGFKVIIDPSHGTKRSDLVVPMAELSLGLNFDGLMMECHPNPAQSVSDADQALSLELVEHFLAANQLNNVINFQLN
jgi:3-deoxy-7-phosphoheptulonate synthase